MNVSVEAVLFFITLGLSLLGTIYIIRQTKLLNGISKLTVIRKRYSLITKIVVFISLFLILIVFLLQSALIAYISDKSNNDNDKHGQLFSILTIVFSILNTICFHGILYLILLRFWLMYFDVQYTISTLDKEWLAYLDPSVEKKNWYFRNISTFGNIKWLIPRLCVLYFISITISITINVLILWNEIIPSFCYMINIILNLIPILINIYIYSKTPTFYDHYYMRDEMKAINNVFIIYLIIQILYYILTQALQSQSQSVLVTIELLYIAIQLILIGILCFVCTGWVVQTISSEYGSYSDAQNCPLNHLNDHDSQHNINQQQTTNNFRFIYITNQPSNVLRANNHHPPPHHHHHHHQNNKPLASNSNYHINAQSNDEDQFNEENHEHHEHHGHDIDDDEIRLPYPIHRTKKNLEDIEISKKLKLPQILSANESFTLFMQHLSRESSSSYNNVACLLSFVEYVQFKQLLKDNLKDIKAKTFGNAKLAPSIPKSIIVHTSYNKSYNNENIENNLNNNNNNNVDQHNNDKDKDSDNSVDPQLLLKEYKCRAYMLYNKYIKREAELELRLPSDYKKALDAQMDELDKFVNSEIDANQLFHIFDDVIFSQYQIMWKSYQRFVNTGDYQLVENLFHQQQKKK